MMSGMCVAHSRDVDDADKPDPDTTASEDGAEAKGGDWAAEGEEGGATEEEEEESEEAREARLAEYAAAKAEEDAIKQVIR